MDEENDEYMYKTPEESIKYRKKKLPECKRSYQNTPFDKKKDIKIDCFTKQIPKNTPLLLYDEIDDKMKYQPHSLNVNIHWGQRKLFLSEVLFLNECYHLYNDKEEKVFIYAGSATGHHIILLSIMFPDIKFLLYDPAKFAIKETKQIKIFNEYFTNRTAETLKKYKNSLFCSDIRRESKDEIIMEDMKWQSDWVKIIQPFASMLKFRVIYPKIQEDNHPKNKYTYLDGDLYMRQYAPVNSTEMRLISQKNKTKYQDKEYDRYDIESTCFYFNNVIRQQYYYKHKYDCISHHYDGMAEIRIWETYLKNHNIKITNSIVCKLMDLLTRCIIDPNHEKIKNDFDQIINMKQQKRSTKN
jgi:hypothetical protein